MAQISVQGVLGEFIKKINGRRKMTRKYLFILAAGLMIWGVTSVTNATVINYTATDLADTGAGDLWEYTYKVSDHIFAADTGFTIYFDLGLYDFLDPAPVQPNSEWDVLTWNPDPALPDDGAYDAYALTQNASLADTFTVRFDWLGGAAGPSEQYFDVYDSTFATLESSTTVANVAPVPEPASAFLLGTGLATLAGWHRRKRKTIS